MGASEESYHQLTNADFRKLLATPRPAAANVPQTPAPARSQRGGHPNRHFREKKKKREKPIRPIPEEDDELNDILGRYRDRAKERREVEEKENEEEMRRILMNAGSYKAVAPTLKGNLDLAERRKQMIEESKYLGGDMEHTHLVKGLDYALLQKVRSEIQSRSANSPREQKVVVQKSENEDSKELVFHSKMAKNIHHLLFEYKQPKVNELFAPKRMAYVISLGEEDDNDTDLPTILLRSKQECPVMQAELSAAVNDVVVQKLTDLLSTLRSDGKRKKEKEPVKAVVDEESKKIASEDIFEGIGEYVPPVPVDTKNKSAASSIKFSKSLNDEKLPNLRTAHATVEEAKPSQIKLDIDDMDNVIDDRRKEDVAKIDRSHEIFSMPEAKGIKMAVNSTSDSYAECYPGGVEYFDAAGDSDDEADYSKMDLGNRKGLVRRWDFDTEQEYEAYMSSREAMPRAAFQYGVKMNDGRKTRKLPKGRSDRDEKAKLDRQWQQISQILSKRKDEGDGSESKRSKR